MLTVTYDPLLVAVSVAIAIAASFTGLQLTAGINALEPTQRKVVIAKAAIALGSGIWSMHFVGMLAVRLPIVISYDVLPTLISALLAILVVGLGLILLHFGVRTQRRIIAAGCLTGLGIVTMHYVGMSAVRGNCIITYDSKGVVLAVAIAVIASILALEFAYRRRTLRLTVVGSVVLGLAISAMHYAAMLFTTFSPSVEVELVSEPVLSSGSLAIVVSLAAFVICGLFLLVAVPFAVAPQEALATAPEEDLAEPATAPRVSQTRSSRDAAFSRAFAAPANEAERSARLPYEQDQAIRFVAAHEIYAIRADGHYARLINGKGELFCPWSISKI
ncbi:MAG: MHYT domain-containing protein, partial [Pseudomonadota bacterium]